MGLLLLPLLAGAASCGFSTENPVPAPPTATPSPESDTADAPPPMAPPPKSFRDALALGPMGVNLISRAAKVEVTIAWNGQPGVRASLTSKSGISGVRVDGEGAFAMNLIVLDFEDVVLSADQVPPNGVHLSDVHATLTSEPFATRWTPDQDGADFDGTAALRVDWKVVSDSGALPLRPIEANGIQVAGHVDGTPDRAVSTTLHGSADGKFLEWSDLLALSDLTFQLHFSAESSPR